MNKPGGNPYAGSAVTTASPVMLIQMLYDRALLSIEQIRMAVSAQPRDTVLMNREIQRIQDIVTELQVSLDFDRGQPVAGLLAALYDYVQFVMTEVSVSVDLNRLDEIQQILGELRDAWNRALVQPRALTA